MTETKELKPRSFRIDEETAEKFKSISAELGNNQQQTLSKLIETYEFQKGKSVLTQRKGEIETFEKYVTILTRMYMDSLENNENVTKTVEAEFEALLRSKDETIVSLQEQVKSAQEGLKTKETEADSCRKQVEELTSECAKLEGRMNDTQAIHTSAMEDKEKLIQALTQACESYKQDIEEMQKLTLERSAMATKQMQLQKEYSTLEADYNTLKSEYEKEKLTHERELLQKELAYAKEIQEIEQRRKNEIDEYQQKYLELLHQLQQKTKSVRVVTQGPKTK